MIPAIVIFAALSMLGPPHMAREGKRPMVPASTVCDTTYIAIYRHWDYSQPIPIVVEDSVKIYSVGVRP